jgi:hypothetical protein
MAVDSRCIQRTGHSSGFLIPSERTNVSAHGGGKILTSSTVCTDSAEWITVNLSCHRRHQAFKRSYTWSTGEDLHKQEEDCKPRTKPYIKSSGASQGIGRKMVSACPYPSQQRQHRLVCMLSLNSGLLSPRDTVQCAGED